MRFDVDNVARFICSDNKDKLLCDSNDYAILNTQGKYVDLCIQDKDFLEELLASLKPYQYKTKNIIFDVMD